jgi:hypothetical protein
MRVGLGRSLVCAAAAWGACAACGHSAPLPPPPGPTAAGTAQPATLAPALGATAPETALPPLSSPETLASRSAALAPGMHEVARGDLTSAGPPPVLVRAERADTCARVSVVAEPTVHVWLTDARGTVLADAASTRDASLGARGPVCVRQGSAIVLHAEGSGRWAARYVAWATP